jgi:hypothetical protein
MALTKSHRTVRQPHSPDDAVCVLARRVRCSFRDLRRPQVPCYVVITLDADGEVDLATARDELDSPRGGVNILRVFRLAAEPIIRLVSPVRPIMESVRYLPHKRHETPSDTGPPGHLVTTSPLAAHAPPVTTAAPLSVGVLVTL